MSVLRAQNLTKLFLLDIVFSDLSFEVAAGDRVAIVGPNGCGKSTLLKIVAGLEPADSGAVHRARGLRIGYQPQEARFDADASLTLRGAMLEAFADVIALEGRMAELQGAMATEQGEALERLLAEYAELEHTFELRGGYDYDLRIERVLAGLGFERDDFDRPCDQLSGGQRTRAALGRVLLGAPDLLLLDEPTNHLDITAREWLENFLADWKGALIVVAHDRFFLDKVCNQVWDMEFGRLERYPGNYTKYESLRESRRERLMAEYEAQQREIAKTEEFIRRYKNSQKSREARGREKRLNRLERLRRPESMEKIRLDLKGALRSGDLVLATDRLEVGYRDRDAETGELRETVLLRCPDLVIRREDRVALVGPNGTGKTTLLKTVVGQLWPLRGEVSIGPSVHVGYYAQAHEGLNADATVLQEILGASADLTDGPARNFLGKYLFSGEDVFKRVGDLSGGERSRVALAKLELAGANWLILDEPTNHLDIRSQATLQDVLTDYDGTILFVSHDRWFIDALATQIWSVEDGTVRVFQGTYSEWMRYRREQEAQRAAEEAAGTAAKQAAGTPQNGRPAGGRSEKEYRRELERVEREIATLEARQAELEGLLATPAEGDGLEAARRIGEWGREHAEVSIRLDGLMNRWAEVAEALEAVQVRG